MSWEQGYEAGNAGLLKAVETAKLLGAVQERKRIIKVLDEWLWDNAERLGTTYMEIWITKFIEDVKEVTERGNK